MYWLAALAVGHPLRGPEPAMRGAAAITSAARNPGLARREATQNEEALAIVATILACLMASVATIGDLASHGVAWRRRRPHAG